MILLLACAEKGTAPTSDIVVMLSVDTLGLAMARETAWCERLEGILADHGMSVACLDGAVAPSSWTAESHVRMLWPQNTVGEGRAHKAPTCGQKSVFATIRESTGGRYFWGSDNIVLSSSGMEQCGVADTQWSQDTDRYDDTHEGPEGVAVIAEEERAVHATIDAYESELSRGKGIQLFLNVLEPGGHEPRCWFDPDTAACDEIWTVAANNGLVAEGADRRAAWLDPDLHTALTWLFGVRLAEEEIRWRPLFWQSTVEAVEHHRETLFDARLRRILDATAAADRLDDLHLVVLGDHGENPCVARGLGEATLNCGHNGIPTEFTAFVPVFVSPASMVADWEGIAGDADQPWSTVNVAFGLLASLDIPVPNDWGPMEAPGTATSWTCKVPDRAGGPSGIHIEGSTALRCSGTTCEASTFEVPASPTHVPAPVVPIPEHLVPFQDWFTEACL